MAQEVVIRPAAPADGATLMRAVAAIDAETEFLGVPGQPHPWAERPEAELRSLAESDRGVVLLALDGNGAIVGYLSAFAGHFARNRGTVFIAVIGLREAWRGRGIGTRLFAAIETWARNHGAWRIDLRVSSLNQRGQALYHKSGFVIEGRIRGGVLRHGEWTDDFWMAKLLDPPPGELWAAVAATTRPVPGRQIAAGPTVRELRAGDGVAFRAWDISACGGLAYSIKAPSEVASIEAIERDIASRSPDPRLWTVATVPERGGERIVGFASGSIEFGYRMQHDAFVSVVVLSEWGGQGIGRRLHNHVEGWARMHKVRRLTATIQAPSAAGRAFAAGLGYEPEVTMRRYSLIEGRMVDRLRYGKLFAG